MKKIISIILAAGAMFLLSAFLRPAFGDRRCEQMYGGGEVCYEGEILIDKTVKNPSSGNFVDNLSVSDYLFSNDNEVVFHLRVKNTGDEKLSTVEVKDIFPKYSDNVYVDFVSSDEGSWDSGSRTWTVEFNDLEPGDYRDFEIKGKMVLNNEVTGTYCMTNTGRAESDDKEDEDTAQVCEGKEVKKAEKLPEAGPEDGQIILASSLGFLGLGLFFLRKAQLSEKKARVENI
jgi:hypothetical protein